MPLPPEVFQKDTPISPRAACAAATSAVGVVPLPPSLWSGVFYQRCRQLSPQGCAAGRRPSPIACRPGMPALLAGQPRSGCRARNVIGFVGHREDHCKTRAGPAAIPIPASSLSIARLPFLWPCEGTGTEAGEHPSIGTLRSRQSLTLRGLLINLTG